MRKFIVTILILAALTFTSCVYVTTETNSHTTDTSAAEPTLDTVNQPADTSETVLSMATTDTEEDTTARPAVKPVRISFLAMGDNLIHSPIFKQSLQGDGSYDFSPKYEKIADMVAEADIAFINQETPMCGADYGYHNYPQFNTPQAMGKDLVDLGFDVICFANNHVADMCYTSRSSILDMLDYTDTLDAMTYGVYRGKEDFDNINVYEFEGVKIAFLAFTYGTNVYDGETEPKGTGAYIPVYSRESVTDQMQKTREISDFIIVSMHWGDENRSGVNDEQREYAKLLADLGADVIIGTHPHVIQPIEWIEGKEGNRTLCYFSLGNGINCQDYWRNMVGICAKFDIVSDGDGVRVENIGAEPVFTYQKYAYKNVYIMPLSELTEDIVSDHHCRTKDKAATLEQIYRIVTDVISAEYLPDYLK